jgi:MFS family permease
MIGIVGLIGIFCTYLLQSGTTLVNPAISGISDGLGMTVATVVQIGTLPAIFAVLSSFLVGHFSGKLIKYKTTILVSLFVFVVGGSLPVFIPVWPVILFSRVCAGLGVGVSCTLPPVLIMKFYEDNRQQRNNIGIGSAVASVGGWIGQVAAGILVGIEWNFVFSIYWLGLLGFVLLLIGRPEPAPMEVRATEVNQ